MKRIAAALALIFAASVGAGVGPASANDGPTVDRHEYERVQYAYGMPKAKVERIFDAKGILKRTDVFNGVIVGADEPVVILGPSKLYWYDNACDSSPVNILYTFYLGRWVLTQADAYYPDTSPKPGCGWTPN